MKKRLFSFFLVFILLLGCFAGTAYGTDGSDSAEKTAADSILAYYKQQAKAENLQELLDKQLINEVGQNAEWIVFALSRYASSLDYTGYASALKNALETGSFPPATRQKLALALIACGCGSDSAAGILDETIDSGGIMTRVFGLHLMNNGVSCDRYSAEDVLDEILSLQLNDGGWAIAGENADADVTAMTLQALAPHRTEAAVQSAVEQALSCLSNMQSEDGTYASYGESNAESTLQVLMALISLSVDYASDSRFVKNGNTVSDGLLLFRNSDGSFCHVQGEGTSPLATAQALCAFTALSYEGSGFYVWEDSSSLPAAGASGTSAFSSYKPMALLIIAGLALCIGLILFFCKKRNPKNYVFLLIAAVLSSAFILFTDFQSTTGYYQEGDVGTPIGTVSLSVCCDAVSARCDSQYIPADGVLLDGEELPLYENDTVYDVLIRAAKAKKLQVENRGVTGDNTELAYIAGIQYLYELDFGPLSGWIYRVNDVTPSVGCGAYSLSDGDTIRWIYTLDLGNSLK